MRVMFSAMSDFTNELAQETLKDHGLDVLPYIKEQAALIAWKFKRKKYFRITFHRIELIKYLYFVVICKLQWAILCKAHITEARWFYGGHTPTFDEYIKNGWISIGSLGGLVLLCFVEANSIVDQFPHCLKDYSQLFYWSSLITRLSDDLGTSKVTYACSLT